MVKSQRIGFPSKKMRQVDHKNQYITFEERILRIKKKIIIAIIAFNVLTLLIIIIQSFLFHISFHVSLPFFGTTYLVFTLLYTLIFSLSQKRHLQVLSSFFMLLLLSLQIITLSKDLPIGSQVYMAFFLLPILSYLMFPPTYWNLRSTMTLLSIIFFASCAFLVLRKTPLDPLAMSNFFIISTFIFLMEIIIIHHFYQATYFAERILFQEKQRSEALLLNILPPSIADRLKSGEEIISDHYQEVSILFPDLVGFKEFSTKIKPYHIVELLNSIFYVFDTKCKELGLEKIKAFGDGYMVMGGGLNTRPHHVDHILELGLFMISFLKDYNEKHNTDLLIRIGVHVGEVIAGVIGKTKFSFDLFGDTVNLASRMESEGLPMKIQITKEVKTQLKDSYHVKERGLITIKGKGQLKTYLLS